MTPQAAATQPNQLDSNAVAAVIRTLVDSIPHHASAGQEEKLAQCRNARSMLAGLRPRDVGEAMLAVRIVATEFHIVDNYRRAAEADLPDNLKLRYRGSAAALTRSLGVMQRELVARQAHPLPQPAVLNAAQPTARPEPAKTAAADAPRPQAPVPQGGAVAGQRGVEAPRRTVGGPLTGDQMERLAARVQAMTEEKIPAAA
jgi:hypothetical protein